MLMSWVADQVAQLRPQARDYLVGRLLAALVLRLEGDEHIGLVGAAVAHEHADAGDGGIRRDGRSHGLDLALGLGEGCVL